MMYEMVNSDTPNIYVPWYQMRGQNSTVAQPIRNTYKDVFLFELFLTVHF